MMALSGVRSSWLMVARKRLLALLMRSDSLRAISSARSCTLRSVTSRSTATTSRSPDVAAAAIERPAAHFDPGKMAAMRLRIAVAADAEFDRAVFAERGRIGQRGQIGRPVGHMHAVEQAVAGEFAARARRTAVRPPARRTARRRCLPCRVMTSVMLRASRR